MFGVMRLAGLIAMGIGYGLGRGRRCFAAVWPGNWRAARWRVLDAGHIKLRVPPTWGDLERLETGGLVVHNRPERDRIEGDAVWYGSAIELMIGPPDPAPLPALAPMREHRWTIESRHGPVVASLRVANGVSPGRAREALRALHSIRVTGKRP